MTLTWQLAAYSTYWRFVLLMDVSRFSHFTYYLVLDSSTLDWLVRIVFLNCQINRQTNQLNIKKPTLLQLHPSHALPTKWSDFGCEKSIPLISRHRAATKPKTPHHKPFKLLLHPINKKPQISSSKPPFLIPGKPARLHTSTSTSATAFVIFKNQATIRSFKLHTSRRFSSVFSAFAFLTCH